ncbi:hypothetical protein [Ferrimicrobium sp.]|uniref:hypothetical protein n=1 Tax=Ferrimicrobium sp. TaxID=2926050 RepID=UPI0026098EF3|nr:hypothetical protein [Ferrimicrobium sp.]
MLDALYAGWQADVLAGKDSLMIAPDRDSVRELNVRAREERIERGEVSATGVKLRDGTMCGAGDDIVTRENNRLLGTRNGWVKNGDRWSVSAIDTDGSLWVRRIDGKGEVRLPSEYVLSSVELGYAMTVYRAQGRTVTSAHTLIGVGTTREVLYVGVTRGRETNHLYVDTGFGDDQSTSHGPSQQLGSAREVLVGCLTNSGIELGARETIRAEQEDAESIGRLYREYETIARLAEESRYGRLLEALAIPGFEELRTSESYGSLSAAFRDAEGRGIDLEHDLAVLVGEEKDQLAGAKDPIALVTERVRSWTEKHGSRELGKAEFIVGLMPKARGVDDADFVQALDDREKAIRERAFALVDRALEDREDWILGLGPVPRDPRLALKWKTYTATVAAYRELWGVSLDSSSARGTMAAIAPQQASQTRQVRTAIYRARRLAEIAARAPGESQTVDLHRTPPSDRGIGWPPIPTL